MRTRLGLQVPFVLFSLTGSASAQSVERTSAFEIIVGSAVSGVFAFAAFLALRYLWERWSNWRANGGSLLPNVRLRVELDISEQKRAEPKKDRDRIA
jgi:small neutral amino acid transporter SnatA (MarC family)